MEVVFEKSTLQNIWQTDYSQHILCICVIFSSILLTTLSNLQWITNVKFQENVIQRTIEDICEDCMYRMLISVLYFKQSFFELQ